MELPFFSPCGVKDRLTCSASMCNNLQAVLPTREAYQTLAFRVVIGARSHNLGYCPGGRPQSPAVLEADKYHVLKVPTVFHTVRLSGRLSSPTTTYHIVNIWLTQDTQAKMFISMIFQGQASSGKVNIYMAESVQGLGWPRRGVSWRGLGGGHFITCMNSGGERNATSQSLVFAGSVPVSKITVENNMVYPSPGPLCIPKLNNLSREPAAGEVKLHGDRKGPPGCLLPMCVSHPGHSGSLV